MNWCLVWSLLGFALGLTALVLSLVMRARIRQTLRAVDEWRGEFDTTFATVAPTTPDQDR